MKDLRFGERYAAPVTLALGFFDCVHLGHAAVISRALEEAAACGGECAVFTFSNDPGALLGNTKRIYTFRERVAALDDLGADLVVHAPFDAAFSELSAEEFCRILTDTLDVKALVCGEDYTYGAHASGNAGTLAAYAAARGMRCDVVPVLKSDGEKISSTRVKEALAAGDISAANAMLSEPYFVLGKVSHAHGRGSSFGYPTANIPYDETRLYPAPGVYATKLTVDGQTYLGGTNIGSKPTFGDTAPSVETFILDFCGDIYGRDVKLAFFKRLRGIEDFGSAEALAAQLGRDKENIRALFAEEYQ